MPRTLLGAVEAGGTKFVVALGTGPGDLRARTVIPTTTPGETLARVADFLAAAGRQHGAPAALGVACFGPVDPDPASPRFGQVTKTPKPGWSGTDVAGFLRARFPVPIGFDTDVNGAALGEHRWGAARGLDTFVYLTVGTGIGGGGMARGRLLHGLVHPEMGHLPVPRDPLRDPFPGMCPFHGDCLEGLASGPAIEARWGRPCADLAGRADVWDLEAEYLGAAVAGYTLVLSPRRVILGGGVMQVPGLIERVRVQVAARLAGYVDHPALQGDLSGFVVAPGLGQDAGVLGALALAARARR
jgi:fructokinase